METRDEKIEMEWNRVKKMFLGLSGKKPTLNSVLFVIGVNELGRGKRKFSKEQKQDLMHIAVCKVLSPEFYEFEGYDQEGWPHYRIIKALPKFDLLEQEKFLKERIIQYFNDRGEL